MIAERDVKLIIDVFKKASYLTPEEQEYLNKLNLIQEKVELHDEFLGKLKVIDEKLYNVEKKKDKTIEE